MAQISLKTNERILATGKTGSGKTYLSRYITQKVKRLVVLDGKGTLSDWDLVPYGPDIKRTLFRNEPIRTRVLAPIGSDILAFWEEVLEVCFIAGNLTLYIDELYAVSPPNQRASNNLWSIYTRGRELGIGVWACTQRPAWIPLFALSEAEHFFCFRLQLNDDRARMAEFMGPSVLNPIKDIHGFWYARAVDEEPRYIKQLEVTDKKTVEIVKKSVTIKDVKKKRSVNIF